MNVSPMSGPRTLLARRAGTFNDAAGKPLLQAFVPSVPIGQLCVPTKELLALVTGGAVSDADLDTWTREFHVECRRRKIPPVFTQVLITEEMGCIDTVAAEIASIEIADVLADSAADHVRTLFKSLADDALAEDGKGGDIAAFESLTRLHACAGRKRDKRPYYWLRERGREFAEHCSGKGVWKTATGEWMASHEIALDYAHWLFPKFHIWTCRLMADDPRVMGAFERIFGFTFTTAEPETTAPPPRLRLVHDADQEGGAA